MLIIGARPEIAALLEGSLPENCTILGHTGYDDVPALLGNSRVGLDVHPWAEPHLKVAVPVKVCEYMAAGCAVVCSSMPVLDSILVMAGAVSDLTLLDGGTAAEYAQGILKTLSAIDSGDDPGAKLRDMAYEHISWEGESQKIASLYLDLQRRKRAHL